MINIFKNIGNVLKNETDVVEIIEKGNLILISIKKECSFKEYLNYINNLKENKKIVSKLPTKIYITDNFNVLESNLMKQLIWYERKENSFWVVTRASERNQLKISLSEYRKENIDELELEIKNNEYKITRYIHDYNFSTSFVKWYPVVNLDVSNYFSLRKSEAIFYINYLLDKLKNAKILSDDDINSLYNIVGLENSFDLKEKIKML